MFAKNAIEKNKRIKFTAYIGLDSNWWSYYHHYKSTLDFLVKGIEDGLPINTVSTSLLFLIRHCLELALKANIITLEVINQSAPKLKLKGSEAHSLIYLFRTFNEHLDYVQKIYDIDPSIKKQIDEYLEKLDSLKVEVHAIDKGSYNFRYPVNTDREKHFEWDKKVNAAEIIDAFYEIQAFLVFIDKVLYDQGVFFDENFE